MSISEPFIRRPVMTTLVTLTIILFGVAGYRSLPVSDLPNVDFPTIQVSANLPGASPETMAAAVATPLERQFSTIAGIDSMTSTSTQGSTSITLQFSLDRSIDAAALDVQTMIARASSQLPRDLPNPPTLRKVNPADQPILYLALSSPTLPLSEVNEYAETTIGQRLSMIRGVAQVQVYGSQRYAVRVQLEPNELTSRSLGIDEVTAAIQSANVNLPTGVLQGPNRAYTIEAQGGLETAAGYRPLVVAWRDGAPVRLEALGKVIDSVENDEIASWYNDTRAIVLAIQRQPGTNTVEIVDAIKQLLPRFREEIPASVAIDVLYDRSQTIRESVADVQHTLLLTIVLVVVVIFFFLHNLSATIIAATALPISIVGTFAAMSLLGYNLDNLSLLALTLSVGFVVDDAIVVLENVVRHVEEGAKPWDAALLGAKEIGFTVLSMTLSLVAVFVPVLFMGGILGRLLREFAVTISVAILISGFVSLTLTPMLASRFLRRPKETAGKKKPITLRAFDWLERRYERSLRGVLRHRRLTLLVAFASLAVTAWLVTLVPKGLFPNEDTGQIFALTEAVQGASYASMVENQQKLAAIVAKDPNVDAFMSSVGAGGPNSTSNTGRIFMRLKPRSQRDKNADEVIQELRPKLGGLPGIRAYLQNPPVIRLGGTLTRAQYQFTLQGPDIDALYAAAGELEGKLRGEPMLLDVASDLQLKNPQLDLRIDRDRAAALGLSAQRIEEALFTAFGSRQVSTILAPTNQYQVILELDPRFQRDPSALDLLYVRSNGNAGSDGVNDLVPLSAVTRSAEGVGPLSVNHLGQLPAVTLSFNLPPNVSLGAAVSRVQSIARAALPEGISTSFQGSAQAFQASLSGLGFLILFAILIIYVVLGVLYESFVHPLTILSGLPSAGLGALLALLIFRDELNLYSFVGLLLLVGIVKKNAIMMIDFALESERERGKSPEDAIFEGAVIRFRPIMMTTLAAMMGAIPIALGLGAGAEARRPLGIAVVGGLLFSQLLTLYITPVIYTYLDAFKDRVGRFARRFRRKEAEAT